jgi:hypothetical protein
VNLLTFVVGEIGYFVEVKKLAGVAILAEAVDIAVA